MKGQNNKVHICGEIITNPTFSHEVFGEKFYEIKIQVRRLSGFCDVLPMTVSERLMQEYSFAQGSILNAYGEFRSYNKLVNGKSKLMLTIFVTEVVESAAKNDVNEIVLQGHICKNPVYRTTPSNREVSDLLIAVNRDYNKSDYIPCIAWGRNALFSKSLKVGDQISVVGRVQSREYEKRISKTEIEKRIAYEVSINQLYIDEMTDQK